MKIFKRLFQAILLVFAVVILGTIEMMFYSVRWIITGKPFPEIPLYTNFLPF